MEYIYINTHIHIHSHTPPFVFRTALILRGIDSTRCWKHCSEILVHIVMIASRSCCRFVVCTSMMWISRSTTSQSCSIGLRSGDCGGHLSKVNSLSCSRNQSEMIWETSLRWFELCDMVHYPAGSTSEDGSWWERHPVWSSAAVAHLLQGSMCCVFRDGILQILVVTSGYLSYCCLSIISNQSVHSPLTSDTNKAFSSTQLPLTGYFLFFGPFSVNPRDGCVWKSQ